MLSTPVFLSPTYVRARTETEYAIAYPVIVDSDLETMKHKIEAFKIKHGGDMEWKKLISRVEQPANLTCASKNPPSRAYYKLVEVMRTCAIQSSGCALALCDAPGGFIQCILDETSVRVVHGMSLRSRGALNFLPAVAAHAKVNIIDDLSGNSDILREDVREEIVGRCKCMDLVTADGAVDNDLCIQDTESGNAHLILSELLVALPVQVDGASFVLKLFGAKYRITQECLAILCSCYESVCIVKPTYSRCVNDELYVVCQKFVSTSIPYLPRVDFSKGCVMSIVHDLDAEWLQELHSVMHSFRQKQLRSISHVTNGS